jgi:hypothetical protein
MSNKPRKRANSLPVNIIATNPNPKVQNEDANVLLFRLGKPPVPQEQQPPKSGTKERTLSDPKREGAGIHTHGIFSHVRRRHWHVNRLTSATHQPHLSHTMEHGGRSVVLITYVPGSPCHTTRQEGTTKHTPQRRSLKHTPQRRSPKHDTTGQEGTTKHTPQRRTPKHTPQRRSPKQLQYTKIQDQDHRLHPNH